ncbi:DUF4387 family protein [Bradyrhizobium erythrophlei]
MTDSNSFTPSGPISPRRPEYVNNRGCLPSHPLQERGPFLGHCGFFFASKEAFKRCRDTPALGPKLFARLFDTNPKLVTRQAVDRLYTIKISYPRPIRKDGCASAICTPDSNLHVCLPSNTTRPASFQSEGAAHSPWSH